MLPPTGGHVAAHHHDTTNHALAVHHASQLLDLHRAATAHGYRDNTYPHERIRAEADAMYAALGHATKATKHTRAPALHLAHSLTDTPAPPAPTVWRIEVLITDPRHYACGQWATNPQLTGHPSTDEDDITTRAHQLEEDGNAVRITCSTTTLVWTSRLPWDDEPGTAAPSPGPTAPPTRR